MSEPARGVRIFISYSRADTAFVERLMADLRASGATIWIDHESLPPGHPDWQTAVRRGIEASTTVIYIGSPDAAQSINVGAEVQISIEERRNIIPVWARGDQWSKCAPFELIRANYLDARVETYPAALANLQKALGLPSPIHPVPPSYGSQLDHIQHPIYILQNVVYRYPKSNFELRVPRLDIPQGQLTYIGGESGCGKSTLLKLLALETVPQQGEMVIMGFPVTSLPQDKLDDLREGGIVYLAQGGMGLRNRTPVANISRLLHDFDGLSWEDAERRALEGLRAAQFPAGRLDVKVMDLANDERARVGLAKLYAARRPICLTDETLSPLDDKMRLRLIALFQMLAAQQFTIISIEHQPTLMDYFDRVITLKQGRIESVVDHPRQQVQAP